MTACLPSSQLLKIKLVVVGREWYAAGSGESVFVELTAKLGGTEYPMMVEPGETSDVGNYTIQVLNADPFGENRCELFVTQRE